MRFLIFLITVIFYSKEVYSTTGRYRLIVVNDPSTTITIAWDQTSGTNPIVYYDTVDHGMNHLLYNFSKTVDRTVVAKGMNNNFARLSSLIPNTNYYFVIRDSQGTSQRIWFRTAPNDNSRLFFIAGGDSRNNRTPRQNANRLVAKLKPHAILFGGDMTNNDTNSEWIDWFNDWQLTRAADGRMFPIVPTRGNHEGASVVYDLFDTPNQDSYYAMTWGNNMIRTYTLNTEISVLGNQLSWLTNDLSNSSNTTWKMAQYHKPMRPHTASKSEGLFVYNAWANLFYNNGVRLVVDCDSHVGKTTWAVKPSSGSHNDEGFEIDSQNGTVYTGEGCWGAPLRSNDDDKSWTRNSLSSNQFKLIFVDTMKIELRTVIVNNAASVANGSNTNPFVLPSNLNVFNPPSGGVITIYNNNISNPCPLVGTACNDGDTATMFDEEDGFCNCTGVTSNALVTNSYPIASSNDDAEEELNTGVMNLTSSDLELIDDNGSQLVGLRFDNVQIPKTSTLYRAYIQFQTDEIDSVVSNLVIHGELDSNSSAFNSNNFNISNRQLTQCSTVWDSIASWDSVGQAGIVQRSPYLTSIVSEVISQPTWASGNAITFILSGTGKRVAESFDGSAPPNLVLFYQTPCDSAGKSCDDGDPTTFFDVEDGNCNCRGIKQMDTLIYAVNSSNNDAEEEVANGSMGLTSSDLELVDESGTTNQFVGIRFTDIHLPATAIVNNAYIQFTVDNDNTGLTNLQIRAELVPNSNEFTTVNSNISSRTTGTRVVNWNNVPPWPISDIGMAGINHRTPNIASLINEVIAQPSWNILNAMTFIISGSGEREAESFDGTAPPRLVIEYSLQTVSLNENQRKESISIYPNPVDDFIYFNTHLDEIAELKVYDVKGIVVLEQSKIRGGDKKIDLSSLRKGIYFVCFKNNGKTTVSKVIKN